MSTTRKRSVISGQRAGTSTCRRAPTGMRTCRLTSPRGFTLTELLVAVAVLVIVIAGTSKIFGTASKVTGLAQANQDVLAEAAAIEAQIREDISRLSREGFFAVHNVAVSNDVRGPAQPLLNPNLPPNAIIRADQLVFFATGVEGAQAYRLTQGGNHKSQGTVSRVYYGHGFQLPRGLAVNNVTANTANSHDPDIQAAGPITPWWVGNVNMVRTSVLTGAGTNNYSRTAAGVIDGTQPQAPKWLFCRQAVALLDDDTQNNNENGKTVYLGQTPTARSIFIDQPGYGWCRELRNGRVDAAASLLNEIRRWVTFSGATPRPWLNPAFPIGAGGDQKTVIRSSVYYPRAERAAPSTHRVDQALTNTVISSACSSIIIDWTYEGSDLQRIDANGNIIGGVGEVLDVNGNVVDPTPASPNSGDELTGVIMTSNGEQQWFGLTDGDRGVFPYYTLPTTGTGPLRAASTILPLATLPNNIESQTVNTATLKDYWAVFGFNQDRPLNASGNLDPTLGYTPWPTALRITMTLHDPAGRLEAGREVQFIIDLPRKRK